MVRPGRCCGAPFRAKSPKLEHSHRNYYTFDLRPESRTPWTRGRRVTTTDEVMTASKALLVRFLRRCQRTRRVSACSNIDRPLPRLDEQASRLRSFGCLTVWLFHAIVGTMCWLMSTTSESPFCLRRANLSCNTCDSLDLPHSLRAISASNYRLIKVCM